MCLTAGAIAQVDHWTTVRVGTLECQFPEAYTRIDFTGASGLHYEGGTIFMTITSLPDTSRMKGDLNRDYTRDFMEVVLATSRRLQGRVREFRDSVIGNKPAYISRQEVRLSGGKRSYYDLVQVLDQDSLRGFSAQYYIGDARAAETARVFFESIRPAPPKPAKKGFGKYGLWIGGTLLVVIAVWAYLRFRSH